MKQISIISAAVVALLTLALTSQAQPATNWNAWNDFYFNPSSVNNSGGSWSGNTTVNPAWQYGCGNVNGNGYAPASVGWFLPPQSYFYSTMGGGQIPGTASYLQTGPGTYFAYFTDVEPWGEQVGTYNYVWETNAPGVYHTTNNSYLWLQDANISGTGSGVEGICAVLQFTCLRYGSYTFTGSFQAGQGYGVDTNQYVDVAICDNTRPSVGLGTNPPVIPQDLNRTLVQFGNNLPYSFTLTNVHAGTLVQWQVGNNFFDPSPCGVQAAVTFSATPPVLLSADRSLSDSRAVIVTFDEPLDANSATNPSNYSIAGARVTAVQFSPFDPTDATVILTVAPGIDYATTLTVNGVEESIQQKPCAPNSQAYIPAPYNLPNGFFTPTNAAVPSFAGTTLDPHWQAALANFDSSQSNFYYTQIFVQSNGVLHCHQNNQAPPLYNNFLIYADPAYSNVVEETLMHMSIVNVSNNQGLAVCGAAVGVPSNPQASNPGGGNTVRAVIQGYAGLPPLYPFWLASSDFVADETAGLTNFPAWTEGGSYWIRIRQDINTNAPGKGAIVSYKVWAGDGSVPEPSNWTFTYTDSQATFDRSGYCSIRAGCGVGQVLDFDVDYFQATAAGLPVVTPTLPTSLIPRIEINLAVNGGNAIASWPAAAPVKYTLQSSTSLQGPWVSVGLPVVVVGPANTVTMPLTGQTLYLRLVQ